LYACMHPHIHTSIHTNPLSDTERYMPNELRHVHMKIKPDSKTHEHITCWDLLSDTARDVTKETCPWLMREALNGRPLLPPKLRAVGDRGGDVAGERVPAFRV